MAQARAGTDVNTWTFTIEDFLPCTANQLLARTQYTRTRLKGGDQELVWYASRAVPEASKPRRVSVTFVYPPGKRMRDVDSMQKSLLDALVATGCLVDDHPKWCQLGPWESVRGVTRATVVTLEDLA